eukprot:1431450-Rhodomonas_salina.3
MAQTAYALRKEKVKKRRLKMLVTLASVKANKWSIDGMTDTSRMNLRAGNVASRPSFSFDTPKSRANKLCRQHNTASVLKTSEQSQDNNLTSRILYCCYFELGYMIDFTFSLDFCVPFQSEE